MTLRVSHLVAALVLLSLSSSQIGVNAADCTDEEQTYLDETYSGVEEGIAITCGAEVCTFECQDQVENVGILPDCTSADGVNYRQMLASNYACTESTDAPTDAPAVNADGYCSEEIEIQSWNMINEYQPDTCEPSPCESSCYNLIQELGTSLTDCKLSDGTNYAEMYLIWTNSCSATYSPTTAPDGTTTAPATTAAPATSTATSASPATTSGTSTHMTATPTARTSAPSTGNTASSEATDEEEETAEASASAAGSASASKSASKDNGAAAVAGSAFGSLVVAGTLALLAAQA